MILQQSNKEGIFSQGMKISAKDFASNRSMLNKNVLRFCENFASHCANVQGYFNEPLNLSEHRILLFLLRRITDFLAEAPVGGDYTSTIARYRRVFSRLAKINYTELKKGDCNE